MKLILYSKILELFILVTLDNLVEKLGQLKH